jgi:tRNA A37 threonylcarbamoyladenosine dehydratase
MTLTRLGIGAFNIADFDTFDVPNINRQTGAGTRNLGGRKSDALSEMALDVNSGLKLNVHAEGISAANIADFLEGWIST